MMTDPARARALRGRTLFSLAIGAIFLVAAVLSALGGPAEDPVPAYVHRLFSRDRVHRVEIDLPDWEGFLQRAPLEEYALCSLVIDGEPYPHAAIRAKGNNSRRLVEEYGHDRYSLKLEFDHYRSGSFQGLDKLSLDASFQDNSYLKNDLTYDMMAFMGVPTPLTAWAQVFVNGEEWGLFLLIEEPEDAFARRNFGRDHGPLYKPDYKSLSDANDDVALIYTDDRFESYDNIFRNARFPLTVADKRRLIDALRTLSTGEDLETAVDVEEVVSYFAVQAFVVNLDSYLGKNGHNYFLYEEEGRLQILPWDYNLAFATYSLGMPDPINDAELYVNYPIFTPAPGDVMLRRPLYHQLMLAPDIFVQYKQALDRLLSGYFESGRFDKRMEEVTAQIAPYVATDPTAFCSYEDFLTGVDALTLFCRLRAQSVRGQLLGTHPGTWKDFSAEGAPRIPADGLWLPDLGEIADLH